MGRGLDVLLGDRKKPGTPDEYSITACVELPVAALTQGQSQPRRQIDDENLAELAESIRQQGVLQPLLVRVIEGCAAGAGFVSHEIVAGERRWRAAKLAGLETVPVLIRDLDDQSALAVALIENLQRDDLNPIEIAESLQRLTREFGLTHEQAAESVGRSRSSVSNLLRLLELDPLVRSMLVSEQIDMGHARALLPLAPERQAATAKRVAEKNLSVRQVEQMVAMQTTTSIDPNRPAPLHAQTRWLQNQLSQESGVKVAIRSRKDGGHTVAIDFDSLDQLQDALGRIQSLVGQVQDTAGPRVAGQNR